MKQGNNTRFRQFNSFEEYRNTFETIFFFTLWEAT